jgi:hypothetical protein
MLTLEDYRSILRFQLKCRQMKLPCNKYQGWSIHRVIKDIVNITKVKSSNLLNTCCKIKNVELYKLIRGHHRTFLLNNTFEPEFIWKSALFDTRLILFIFPCNRIKIIVILVLYRRTRTIY